MGSPGTVSLLNLITQAQFRADMINSTFVQQAEWATYLSSSYKELYDLLVAAYGNDYPAVLPPFTFTTTQGQQYYPLPDGVTVTDAVTGLKPPAFYKMLGLDLELSGTSDSNVTLKPFMFSERNRFSVPNFQSFYGVTNLRYRIYGNQIWLTPIPNANQNLQLFYLPEPTSLVTQFFGTFTSGSAVVPTTDTSNLVAGQTLQTVQVNGVVSPVPVGATILSIILNTSITMSAVALSTSAANTSVFAYNLKGSFDGISGWEEYVVVDAAIKALQKEESDCQLLMAQKEALRIRIMAMADTRDAGSPARVADTQFNDFGWGDGNFNGSGTW